jgi:TPR repeat protein
MYHSHRPSLTPVQWFAGAAALFALLAASGCTLSNANPGTPKAASLRPSPPVQSQPSSPPAPKPISELAALQQKANAGDPDAMYRVGRLYATGSGLEKDYVEAFNWYKRSAKAGNTDAMYALGQAYEHGSGVREDIQQAVNWYDQATLRGHKAAKAALDRLGEDFDR